MHYKIRVRMITGFDYTRQQKYEMSVHIGCWNTGARTKERDTRFEGSCKRPGKTYLYHWSLRLWSFNGIWTDPKPTKKDTYSKEVIMILLTLAYCSNNHFS
jgi:hypothetical protein